MLMVEASAEMLEEWKDIWRRYKDQLKPNRKSGAEIIAFLQANYAMIELYDNAALAIINENVLHNEAYREKLPPR